MNRGARDLMSIQSSPQIESSTLSLSELLKDFYAVPDFQREYVWQPTNVERRTSSIRRGRLGSVSGVA
jgi:uncharacterized protein with ParB-like and HNH nuclease domain